MSRTKNNQYAFLSAICLLLLVAGCALNAHRMHPEFDVRADCIKKSVLITPDVNMYELSSHGVAAVRHDWSCIGRQNLQVAIMKNLKDKQCNIKLVGPDAQESREMAEVRTLYKLVHKTMDQQTLGSNHQTAKADGFNYSLGSLETILQKLNSDAIIFVTGYDQVSNEGRKALIDLAIADSSGTILYYSVKGTTQGKDLRDPVSTATLVQDLLSSLPRMEG